MITDSIQYRFHKEFRCHDTAENELGCFTILEADTPITG